MNKILEEVKGKKAHENTMYHALYDYFVLKQERAVIAHNFGKTKATIGNWIRNYENDGRLVKEKTVKRVYKKFGTEKREWIVSLYKKNPMLHLQEASTLFVEKFGFMISPSSVSVILHEAGMSYKVIERRATEIKMADVNRFCNEMDSISWNYEQLIFLDEVSLNGDCLTRKRGFGPSGEHLIYRGKFRRTSRKSFLCFIAVEGLVETFETEGTFDRSKFVECCKKFACGDNDVHQYPGRRSVWLLDGAKIHCSPDFINFLRSLGIVPIFLPAYCPFMNPIEFMFALLKKRMEKFYNEAHNKEKNDDLFMYEILNSFTTNKMDNLFKKCGYMPSGFFDISKPLSEDLREFKPANFE